ncbi:ATP-binding protein [Bhargavaea ginsengi]|nr:ATP-binding protein [Bhargavaea ginsengi]
MENLSLSTSNSTGYLYFIVHIDSGTYYVCKPEETAPLRPPSPQDLSVHDTVHVRDIPLFFERIRQAHRGEEFVPFSIRNRDEFYDPLYLENAERLDEHHVMIRTFHIKKTASFISVPMKTTGFMSPLFEYMDEAAVILEPDGSIRGFNRAFTKEFGWTSEDLGDSILSFIPHERTDEFEMVRARLLAGEHLVKYFTVRLNKSGERIPVTISAFPVYDGDGELSATCALFISQESSAATQSLIRLQERIIKDRDQLIVDIMENMDLGIAQYDFILNRFIYLSPAIRGLFEVELNEIYVDSLAFQKYIHADDRAKMADVLCNPDSTGEMEFRVVVPGKELKWLRTKSVPIRDNDGRVVRLIGFTEDVTRQKFSEQMNLKWEKLGMVGHLAAGIAHEVRNPLTAVKGFIQLIDETGSADAYKDIVVEQLDRIGEIVDELLMLSDPHQEDEMRLADLTNVLSDLIILLKAEARVHNCTIRFNIPEGPLPAICKSDEIKHVIINLVKNSYEAMPGGGTVYLSAWDSGEGPIIEVRDEGIGIPEDRLPLLGEPFYSNKEKGTSMGLMKSFKILERHGGSIEFESEVGKGTTARIRLPLDSETSIS